MSETVYLTAEDLAAKLGLHPQTVYRNQSIPRVKIGGAVRFIESQVDQFIALNTERKRAPRKRKPSQKLYDVNSGMLKGAENGRR